MKNINFESIARKISTRMPIVIIILAILMTLVHTVKTALKYNALAGQYKTIKEQTAATDTNTKPEMTNTVSYSTAKVRGTELVNLENEYVSFSSQMSLAQSVKQKENLQAHLDDIASNMKKYLDASDISYASMWYLGENSQGEWTCNTNYDFPDDKEIQEVLLLQTNKDVSQVNAYVIADFNRKTGMFSNFKVHTTYRGLEFILDDNNNLVNSGAGTPQTWNFASLPAIVWDVNIRDGFLYKTYSPLNRDIIESNETQTVTPTTEAMTEVATTLSDTEQSLHDAYKADVAAEESEYNKKYK